MDETKCDGREGKETELWLLLYLSRQCPSRMEPTALGGHRVTWRWDRSYGEGEEKEKQALREGRSCVRTVRLELRINWFSAPEGLNQIGGAPAVTSSPSSSALLCPCRRSSQDPCGIGRG